MKQPEETMQVRVVAQDPTLTDAAGAIVTALVTFPYEEFEDGPIGHRVHVVDYDSSTTVMYPSAALAGRKLNARLSRTKILNDPEFHAQNVYGLVMNTVARFERALGRRTPWSFAAHQIKVVPHAFAVANAFYSPDAEALLFGYYQRGKETVFTCLSHDVVVHDTTHALVDGVRSRFNRPSSPDQAAFHEAFADVVALLSIFCMTEVVTLVVDQAARNTGPADPAMAGSGLVPIETFVPANIVQSALFGLAEQLDDLNPDFQRVGALRRSVTIAPEPGILDLPQYAEPHRRGELMVAAIMQAFLEVWQNRLKPLHVGGAQWIDRQRAIEEGAGIADQLLTMCIRGLDYTPPVHIDFSDFLSAMLTADREVRFDDSKFALRPTLRATFARFGIAAPRPGTDDDGCWERVEDGLLEHRGVRFSNAQNDPTEMFRLIWLNRDKLKLPLTAYCRISDLSPCLRVAPEDGLPVRETVAICLQYVKVPASELRQYGLRKPSGMEADTEVTLEGGSTLILDEYGRLKYEITQPLVAKARSSQARRNQERLDYLWETGTFLKGASLRSGLSAFHRARALDSESSFREVWW